MPAVPPVIVMPENEDELPPPMSKTRAVATWSTIVVRAPAPLMTTFFVIWSSPCESVYVPAGTLISVEPSNASASITAARSEHADEESAHIPSPGLASAESAVVVTANVSLDVAPARCTAPTIRHASTARTATAV